MKELFDAERECWKTILSVLRLTKTRYCLVGGMAVQYHCDQAVEPSMPTLFTSFSLVIKTEDWERFLAALLPKGFRLVGKAQADLVRLTATNDSADVLLMNCAEYQPYIERAITGKILRQSGSQVASKEDLVAMYVAQCAKPGGGWYHESGPADLLVKLLTDIPDLQDLVPESLLDLLAAD